jgi:hypothetical protein
MKTRIKSFGQFIMESIDDDFEFLNNLGLIDINIHTTDDAEVDPRYLEEIKKQLISWAGPVYSIDGEVRRIKLISAEVSIRLLEHWNTSTKLKPAEVSLQDYDFKLEGTLSDGSNVQLYWNDKYGGIYNGLCQIHFIDGTVRKLEKHHEDEWFKIESSTFGQVPNVVVMLLDFTVAKLMG